MVSGVPDLNTTERRRVTLAHVLGMTSGLEWNEEIPYTDPRNDEIRMTREAEPLRYALSRRFAHEPGTEFTYNGGSTQVLAAVVSRATKTTLRNYIRSVLFEPLGITDFEWLGDLAGMPSAASGLRLRPRDLAKFGSLYLHGGRWNGKQVIPAGWVERSTRRHFRFRPRTGPDAGGEFGYSVLLVVQLLPDRGRLDRGSRGGRERAATGIRTARPRDGRDDSRWPLQRSGSVNARIEASAGSRYSSGENRRSTRVPGDGRPACGETVTCIRSLGVKSTVPTMAALSRGGAPHLA